NSDNLIVQGLRYYPAISHSYDHLLIKYSNSGDILYENIYDNGGDDGGGDWLEPMLIDDSNHIFVSFESEQSDSTSILDIVTIKYSHSNDDRLLKSKTNTIPSKYSLAQNFPNPFNPSTLINYSIRENGSVKLEVYNVLGEKIKTLINEYQNSGHKSVVWDGTNDNGYKVASGLYIYKFVAGNYTNIKKMILIK
ncbi:MAG TPA: FlgD immunoglobulin-like domain containing protein, partial [Ignavibacteria bacterium]|nr:FlgD immunoglobulin-like domain containing protein [Ignavibacteria bacterium]